MNQKTNSSSVWYISKYVLPISHDGNGSRMHFIMEEMANIGFDCSIITSDSPHIGSPKILEDEYLIEEIGKVKFLWINTYKYKVSKSFKRILSWLHFEWKLFTFDYNQLSKPNTIIVSSPSILSIVNGFRLRRKYNCKLIFEVRDIWPLTITEEGGYSRWNPFVMVFSCLEQIGYKFSDAIVGTMPNLQEHVNNVVVCDTPIFCIPMGIDLEYMKDSPKQLDADIEKYFQDDKFIIGYAGTIGITNALDSFFECAELLQSRKDLHFLVIGDGDLKEIFQRQYSNLANLSFCPKLPRHKLHSALVACDLLYFSVHESEVWRYGQSLNKLIDYMYSGTPIIASYDGYKSMINEANCGEYISPGDASSLAEKIIYFEEMNTVERNELGEKGIQWLVEKRTYKELANQYSQIIMGMH